MTLADYGVPDEFPGSEQQRRANRATHDWGYCDGQIVCFRCEAKPWHAAASWPCGEQPSRHPVGGTDKISRMVIPLGGLPFEEGDDA